MVFSLAGDLYLKEKGASPVQLTAGAADDAMPTFGGSGDEVYFARDGELHRIDLASRAITSLGQAVDADGIAYFSLEPELGRIALLGSVRQPRVLERDLAGGKEVERVPAVGRWVTFPTYGAPGELILVQAPEGRAQVFSLAPGAAEPRAISALERPPARAAASRDGRHVAFLRDGRAWLARRGDGAFTERDTRALDEVGAHSLSFDRSHRLWVGHGSEVSVYEPETGKRLESWQLAVPRPEVESPAPLSIRNVALLDLVTGTTVPGQRVVIEDGRIRSIGDEASAGPPATDVESVDGTGLFLCPGLFDLHVHDLSERLGAALAYGITTVRELGTAWPVQRRHQQRVVSGEVAGPLILSASEIFEGPYPVWGNGPSHQIESVEEGLELLELRLEEGADLIKFYPTLPRTLRSPLVERAREAGTPAVAHVATLRDIVTFLDDGGTGIEHYPESVPILGGDLLSLMALHGTSWVPTLTVRGVGDLKVRTSAPELSSDLFRRAVPEGHFESWRRRPKIRSSSDENLERLVAERSANVVRAIRSGVRVAVGSDASRGNALVGPSTHWEIEALVQGGLPAHEALAAATSVAAEVTGLNDRGTVREGAVADLLLLEGNPLEDIANTRRIRWVVRGGALSSRDALLDE